MARIAAPFMLFSLLAGAWGRLNTLERQNAPRAWNDSFRSFNASIWTQQTDIEHCNDGACFQARIDHLAYGADGLEIAMTQYPCNTTAKCCVGSQCASWASGHLATKDSNLYGTYEISLQAAHSAGGTPPPPNAFSCWTPTFVGSPHNEIAVCFSGLHAENTEIHYSYWVRGPAAPPYFAPPVPAYHL